MVTAIKRLELASEPSCIYCGGPNETIEHMPPRIMFTGKSRPSGFEFASCKRCNNGTAIADKVAAFLARVSSNGNNEIQEELEFQKLLRGLVNNAAIILEELADASNKATPAKINGIIRPSTYAANIQGNAIRSCLNVFSAKFGMSLYRELIGERLPDSGYVSSAWMLNSGLPLEELISNISKKLSLRQINTDGWKRHDHQFTCLAESNGSDIIAGIAKFRNSNLTILSVGLGTPSEELTISLPTAAIIRPGMLLSNMPPALTPATYRISDAGVFHRRPKNI